jgi:arylsulfatase A-like enzyme
VNIILVMSDSFRHDNLSCYGPTKVKTPRLDKLAAESYVFDNAYLGSFPTIPNRLDIMSGRFSFIDHEWCALPADTVTIQQILSASGVTSQLICDNPHLVEMGFNYERGFDGWEWIRGQETDHWSTSPANVKMPNDGGKNRSPWILKNYLRNTSWWTKEEDHFVARSIDEACKWLDRNQDQSKFFMHIDLFDPHEPWDAPKDYVKMYDDPNYQGEDIIFPQYDYYKGFLTEAEMNHVRAEYLGEASMVDHWVGVLLDKVAELGLEEDTAIIFTSDHGYLFGEHDITGKSRLPIINGEMLYEAIPMYDEIRRVPLMIRLPGKPGGVHIPGIVQAPDLMPTMLELAGLVSTASIGGQSHIQALQCGVFFTSDWQFRPDQIHGHSLLPLMNGEAKSIRDIAVCSNTLIHDTPILSKSAIVTEDGYCLHYAGAYEQTEQGGAMYISKLIDANVSRTSTEPMLFHLPSDPHEQHDLMGSNEALARDIHARYVKWLEAAGTPEKFLAGRRNLR